MLPGELATTPGCSTTLNTAPACSQTMLLPAGVHPCLRPMAWEPICHQVLVCKALNSSSHIHVLPTTPLALQLLTQDHTPLTFPALTLHTTLPRAQILNIPLIIIPPPTHFPLGHPLKPLLLITPVLVVTSPHVILLCKFPRGIDPLILHPRLLTLNTQQHHLMPTLLLIPGRWPTPGTTCSLRCLPTSMKASSSTKELLSKPPITTNHKLLLTHPQACPCCILTLLPHTAPPTHP